LKVRLISGRRCSLLLLLWLAPTLALAATSKTVPRTPSIAEAVRAAKGVARELGVNVVRLNDGVTVFSEAADTPRILASNNKLFTTAAALDRLGPAYQFETTVYVQGPIENGVLKGDVAVVGGADPNISGRFHDGDPYVVFRGWAAAMRAAGITRVSGRLLLIDGIFDAEHVHPDWPRDQLTRWYEAPVGGLSFSDNCILVRVSPGRQAGERVRVELVPPIPEFPVVVTATTSTSKRRSAIGVSRATDGDTLRVSGSAYYRSGTLEAWVTVRSPHEYFGHALRDAWRREGLPIDGIAARLDQLPSGGWQKVTSFTSPLQQALDVTNKRSQNFYAESLFKLLGAKKSGQGSWKTGVEAMGEFLGRVGLPAGTFQVADGSGLSRNNRYTPSQITKLLSHMFRHPAGKEYVRSLAYSGEPDLRWRKRLATQPYKGNVFAKTGTLSDVSSLSGYAKAKSGAVYAFSILCNRTIANWRAEQAEDAIVRAIIDHG
jgi:D-alanyl-D-alanine carboxypeptidase/D-alanyl-D-alanine-endopeptidase (penicillin-binding protein 4)